MNYNCGLTNTIIPVPTIIIATTSTITIVTIDNIVIVLPAIPAAEQCTMVCTTTSSRGFAWKDLKNFMIKMKKYPKKHALKSKCQSYTSLATMNIRLMLTLSSVGSTTSARSSRLRYVVFRKTLSSRAAWGIPMLLLCII